MRLRNGKVNHFAVVERHLRMTQRIVRYQVAASAASLAGVADGIDVNLPGEGSDDENAIRTIIPFPRGYRALLVVAETVAEYYQGAVGGVAIVGVSGVDRFIMIVRRQTDAIGDGGEHSFPFERCGREDSGPVSP